MSKMAWDELVKHLDEGCTETVALDGSEKQVAWANDLRATYITAIEQAWERMIAKATTAGTEADIAPYRTMYARILSGLRGIRYARIWIDAREDGDLNNMKELQMLVRHVSRVKS